MITGRGISLPALPLHVLPPYFNPPQDMRIQPQDEPANTERLIWQLDAGSAPQHQVLIWTAAPAPAVPEPPTWALLLAGGAAAACIQFRIKVGRP